MEDVNMMETETEELTIGKDDVGTLEQVLDVADLEQSVAEELSQTDDPTTESMPTFIQECLVKYNDMYSFVCGVDNNGKAYVARSDNTSNLSMILPIDRCKTINKLIIDGETIVACGVSDDNTVCILTLTTELEVINVVKVSGTTMPVSALVRHKDEYLLSIPYTKDETKLSLAIYRLTLALTPINVVLIDPICNDGETSVACLITHLISDNDQLYIGGNGITEKSIHYAFAAKLNEDYIGIQSVIFDDVNSSKLMMTDLFVDDKNVTVVGYVEYPDKDTVMFKNSLTLDLIPVEVEAPVSDSIQ